MPYEDNIRKLQKLIKGIKVAMMTTVDANGGIHSRPMATQQLDFDGDLWFFTSDATQKVFEVRHNQHVNLAYMNPDEQRYVSVTGRAQIVRDGEKARELWNPLYKAWFPQGLDDPELALMKVSVERAHYWESPSAPVVQLVGFVKAMASGRRYEPGQDHTIEF